MKEVDQAQILSSISDIWRTVLGVNEINMDSSFFELGGGSLQVIKMLYLIEKQFGTEITLTEFFSSPTLGFVIHKVSVHQSSETFSF